MTLAKALKSVSKFYSCDICGQEYQTHRQAVMCADKCLQKQMTAKKVTN